MKQITVNGKEFLLVEVPKDSKSFIIKDYLLFYEHSFDKIGLGEDEIERLPLHCTWSIIGKANDLTEELWKGILPLEDLYWEMKYRIYPLPGQVLEFQEHIAESATQSGQSLITSNGYEFTQTLILQRQ